LLGFARTVDVTYFHLNKTQEGGYSFGQQTARVKPKNAKSALWENFVQNMPEEEEAYDRELFKRAQFLCSEESIRRIFNDNMEHRGIVKTLIERAKKYTVDNVVYSGLANAIVGIDWVGDELGFPFCSFLYPDFEQLVKAYQDRNVKFGIRLHYGEGLVRGNTTDTYNSQLYSCFKLHLFIAMITIHTLYKRHTNIRIGHGVAFLFQPRNSNGFFAKCLDAFRKFVNGSSMDIDENGFKIDLAQQPLLSPDSVSLPKKGRKKATKPSTEVKIIAENPKIIFELNPTSNHLLLSDSFVGTDKLTNDRTLSTFFDLNIPVTLCTDDDGIWSIGKCVHHHHHISVAHEYCVAIDRGEITTLDQLISLIQNSRQYAFSSLIQKDWQKSLRDAFDLVK
jgi:hypothetical protein